MMFDSSRLGMDRFAFTLLLQVMGVLTHLDKFKSTKALRQTKKKLKQRFWTDVYDGAKMFFLSGVKHQAYAVKCGLLLMSWLDSWWACVQGGWVVSPCTMAVGHNCVDSWCGFWLTCYIQWEQLPQDRGSQFGSFYCCHEISAVIVEEFARLCVGGSVRPSSPFCLMLRCVSHCV
jgi:hypothetical protein